MNKITGIIVGVILLGAVGGFVIKTLVFPSPDASTPATGKADFLEVIEVEAKITDVLDAEPSGSEDAGEHYAQAVKVFHDNKEIILDGTVEIGKGDATGHAAALKAFEDIRMHIGNGAKQAEMTYLCKHTPAKLKVSKHSDEVAKLGITADVLDTLGDYYINNKRYKDADSLYRDMLVVGWHMMKSRSHVHMVTYGEDIMGSAMNGIIRSFDPSMEREAKLTAAEPLRMYNNALNEFVFVYREKVKILSKARLDAGDVWKIAEHDKDRMWRVQAILAMGMLKFSHPSKANTARNNELIEKFLASKDRMEKAAAEAAKAYTEVDFNTAGTDW